MKKGGKGDSLRDNKILGCVTKIINIKPTLINVTREESQSCPIITKL